MVQKNWESYKLEKSLSALIPGSAWTSLGPNSSSGGYAGIGRINRITFHPTNTSIIFACTAGGGLWKTINGGSSWVPLTDNLASIGTSGLVINPVDPNIMYLATGDGDGADTYSYGVLKSTDGGVSWNTTGLSFTTGTVIYKLQPHPTDPNILLAGTNGGLYRTANGGTSWTKVVASGQFYDIEALSSTNMVATTKGGLYRSTDSGATWVLVTTIASTGRIALAVSASNPDFVAALVSNTSNGFKGFYASVDGGLTYTLRSSTPNLMGWETTGSDAGGQAWYDLCIAVSPTDVNQIIVGGVNTWKSTNGGVSWTIMTNWYQTATVPGMHADQHDLVFQNSTTIYASNDGGIYRSTNNGVSWSDLTNGMSISQLYRASAAQTDIRIIAGLQDNGTKLRSITGSWSDEIGGDGMDCAIDPTNASYMYGTLYYGDIQRSVNGGASWTSITPSTGTDGDWVSPVLLDPVNPATLYLGYRDLMKSVDRGTTWTNISAGHTGGSYISNIAVATSDPQVIFISWGNAIAKTINGGTAWTTITSPIASAVSSLLVDPTNPNNIYATYSNFTAGSKVYFSTNGGTSWTNISGTLPNIPANKIIYQTGSNGALYLGMDVGVYYRDNTQTDWSLYNSGLPNVEIFDIEIRYSDKKLIAATYGRGVWESPLYVGTPLSVPVVSSFTPTSGSRSTSVTITGSNFSGITSVTFGGVAATSFVVNSATSITAIVGNGASGSVTVTNSAGSGTLAGFTFISTVPTISSFTPTSGKTGQIVTITGTNFTGATSVSFGGTAASAYNVVSATSITATVAAGTTGSVSVTTTSGTGTLAGFSYLPPPAISSFSPLSASTGQTVTITGTNFTGATAVSFGGTAATSFSVVSATSITAIVGAGTSGSVSVTTANGIGTRTGFTYVAPTPAPAISSFTPTSGKTGQVVTITGTNFTGASAVSFGGTAASAYTVVSATSITATVGAGTSGSVSVTTASGTGTLAGFSYLPPPAISSFSPLSASTGQIVTITGTNFTGAAAVSFGGTAATSFSVLSATSITAVVGAGTTGVVSVTTANGVGTRAGFTFVTATPAPAISSFTPTSGKTGQIVTITGTNFTGATAVSFGGTAASAYTVVSATSITATVAAGTSGNVSVTTASGTGTLAGFTYLPPPAISSFSPTSASTGQTVTLTGNNFTGATAVSFGGTAATSFSVLSATSITAVVGAGTTGVVSVTTANGVGTRAGFTFVTATPAPAISSFTPTSGKTGQIVTITGTNFTGATAVSFGGTAASAYTVVSATSITATVAAGTSGNVSVTTASGTGTLAGFTYLPPPAISSFSPTSASTGQTVTLTGNNFTGATAVSFGGTAATSFSVVNATSITAVVGAGTTGSVGVTTANGIGTRAGFTYVTATPAPAISSFSPLSASTGQTVTITGTNFTGASAVSFGGTAATSFSVVSATSITAVIGAGATGSVSVTTASGVGTSTGFTFIGAAIPPTINSFTPTSGNTGQVITITGTNFTGATAVSFGGTAANSFTVVSATSITARVGAGTSGIVSVTTPYGTGTLAGFSYLPPPTITSFTPASAGRNTTISIIGNNFSGTTSVSFGGVAATSFTIVSPTNITAIVGTGATGNVRVTTANGAISKGGFTFIPAPVITSFNPASAGRGQTVTLTGTNFTGATAVSFGGTAATSFTVINATTISAIIGAGTSGNISVTTANGLGTISGFTYLAVLPVPSISAFTPTSGNTGRVVTITGTNFTGATAVSFGGTAASSYTVVSATSITATVGSGSSGSVQVSTIGGNATIAGFTYIPIPTLISFSPAKAAPGSAISLSGSGFSANPSNNVVWIGATKATVTSSTANAISTTVPIGASTDYIRILNKETQLAIQSNNFFISTFSPSKDSISSTEIAPKIDLTTLANPEDIRVSDIDGDGKPDIIVANYTAGSISVFRNTATSVSINVANFTRKDFVSGTNANFISVADLDNDGKQDLIIANQGENTISILKNISTAGNVLFNSPVKITTPLTPIGIGIGDFDKNGWLDIVTANHGNNSVTIFTNKGVFNALALDNFNAGFNLTTGLNPITIDVADLDGDNKMDIAVGNYGSRTVSVFKNNFSNGTLNANSFSAKMDFNAGNNPGYLKLGDMDGDSKLDIVVLAESANSVGILRNTTSSGVIGLSSFAPRVNFNTGVTPYYISVGDITGNGKLDILLTNFADGTATLWQNKAVPGSITSTSFFKRLNFTVGTKPFAGILADIDGDAKMDILVTNSGSNTISILRNIIGAQMIVSPTSSALPATGGSLTATVSSNLVWNVSTSSSWLVPTVLSGRNSGTLKVTFIANTGAARKGVISFTADGIVKTMEISQAAKPGLMNPDKDPNQGSIAQGEMSLDVISDINWELYPNPSNGIINLVINFPNLELTGSLNIQDINGRVIKTMTNLRTGNYQIDLSSEPKGTYLFSLKGENGDHVIYKKLMVN